MNKFAQTYSHQVAQTSLCRGVIFHCWLVVSGLTHAETTNVAGAVVKETNPGLVGPVQLRFEQQVGLSDR